MTTTEAAAAAASSGMTLHDLAPSTILFHLCPFLTPGDLLALRLTTQQCFEILHNHGEDSESMWQQLLQRDFGIQKSHPDWNLVLQVAPTAALSRGGAESIFGIDPTADDFWERVTDHPNPSFGVWQRWIRVSCRVYAAASARDRVLRRIVPENNNNNNNSPPPPPDEAILWAPYFLRAARLWRSIFEWSTALSSEEEAVGPRLRQNFQNARPTYGTHVRDGSALLRNVPFASRMVLMAVYAFTAGQNPQLHPHHAFDGLLGSYQAYDYYSSTSLVPLRSAQTPVPTEHAYAVLVVGEDLLGRTQGLPKQFVVETHTGHVYLLAGRTRRRAVQHSTTTGTAVVGVGNASPSSSIHYDEFLTWLEEYARRLTTGVYRVESLRSHGEDPHAIAIFPQFPTDSPLPLSTGSSTPSLVSRAVTRGVEVIASAVYAPQGMNRFGFIYCIRIRLLQPGEDGYSPASDRGFVTCQLRNRHWRITDDAVGRTDDVNGEGVIGMFPILEEGGYRMGDGEILMNCCFQYQSCTGAMDHGSFRGHIEFVPGSRRASTGPPFQVTLNPFLLTQTPSFLY